MELSCRAWLIVLVGLAACTDDSNPKCVTGAQHACECVGGGTGFQICAVDGTYGECMGCNVDMAVPEDLLTIEDLAGEDLAIPSLDMTGKAGDMVMKVYTATTPHAIDIGMFPMGSSVKITGMVVVAPVSKTFTKSTATCKYETIVQDPTCSSPPCGVVVSAAGIQLPVMDAGTSSCPTPPSSGTLLDPLVMGDNVDVAGVTRALADSMNAALVRHSIDVESLTKIGGAATITAMAAPNDQFITHITGQWMMYEGTVITLANAGGKLTVSSVDTANPFHFHTTPGNADWGTTYQSSATAGLQFTSITGVVDTLFGGAVQPRLMTDFVP
jgi:hypothetical protein